MKLKKNIKIQEVTEELIINDGIYYLQSIDSPNFYKIIIETDDETLLTSIELITLQTYLDDSSIKLQKFNILPDEDNFYDDDTPFIIKTIFNNIIKYNHITKEDFLTEFESFYEKIII